MVARLRPTRRRALGAAAALAALGAAGCTAPLSLDSPSVAELPAPVPDWITIRAGLEDDGRRYELAPGETIAIALRAPSGAGAGWAVVEAASMLRQTGRTSAPVWPPGAPASRVAPAPLWQVFAFEATRPGEGIVELALAGPDGPVRRWTIRVSVAAR